MYAFFPLFFLSMFNDDCDAHVVGVDDVPKDWFVVSLVRGQHCWSNNHYDPLGRSP